MSEHKTQWGLEPWIWLVLIVLGGVLGGLVGVMLVQSCEEGSGFRGCYFVTEFLFFVPVSFILAGAVVGLVGGGLIAFIMKSGWDEVSPAEAARLASEQEPDAE